jgi:hypothetical protein
MASPPTIERPGVQVIQEFRTTSPQILVPTLPACVMGPCFQVIEAVLDDGTLNSEAQVTLPARLAFGFVGATYTGIGGTTLRLSVDNAAEVGITFAALPANKTPAQVAQAINDEEITGLLAEVEESGGSSRVVLRTTAKGENATIAVGTTTSAALLATAWPGTGFNLLPGYKAVGRLGYTNFFSFEPQLSDYPDPRSNLSDLTIDYATVRVFINNGAGNVREALKTETFLDGAGTAVSVINDGDGDNLSPYLQFTGAEFQARNASVTGTVDWTTLTYPADFGTFTLEVYVDGVLNNITFANPVDAAGAISQLNAGLTGATAVLNASNRPVITSSTAPGATCAGSIQIGPVTGGSSIGFGVIGLLPSLYGGPKPGFARALGVVDLTSVATWATDVQGKVLRMSLDGDYWQQLVMPTSVVSGATLVAAINTLWGANVASISTFDNQLVLRSVSSTGGVTIRGKESVILIDKDASDATMLSTVGLTGLGGPFGAAASTGTSAVYGTAFAPAVGDEVWVDGIRLGQVTEIPTGVSNRLRISAEQLLTYTGTSWYVVAKGLDNDLWTTTRPSSDLYIDTDSGTVRVKHNIFRDSGGTPTVAGPLAIYLGYTALRKDVSPATEDFNLLRIGSVADLEAQLSPIDTQNPLGLGMYFAILNAPGLEVTGVGVDDTSTTEPEGTLDAYTRAFEFIESKDVYAIAPLTHSGEVGLVGQVHVDEMSLPANGLERVLMLNPSRPTRKSSTLVASGPLGNVTAAPTSNVVETGIANLQALLAALGYPGPYNPASTVDVPVYLEFEDDTNKYLVQSVSGGQVTINDGPLTAGNDDGFYYAPGSPVFTASIVDRPFTVKIRGALIANRTEEAVAYGELALGYRDRRVIATAPAQAKATLDGLETLIDGYYLSCALAGKTSAKLPQEPMTESTLVGFTGVVGSQDRYSEAQLKILSGSGLWVFYQEADGQPVRTRHQLTTDMSTVEKREFSITTALDFASKLIRASLRNFIGRFNITTSVQDAITTTMEGLRNFLIRLSVFESFEINAIRQNATDPTRLEIDVTVGVFYPLNYIQVTLVV